MHALVPHFILENDAQGKHQGRFDAVGLFVDVAGFSAMADAMMQQGQQGAEVLAEVMRAIFDPLIASVYAQGGFVATLAGDALTALFPLDQAGTNAHVRALAAAWQIQEQMTEQPRHDTPYGLFAVAAKVGLATGAVHWGIVAAADDTRASYYFQGPAVDGCAAAEHLARAGQIIVAATAWAQVQDLVTAMPVADHFQITAVTGVLPAGQPITLPTVDAAHLRRFYPPELITQRHSGEFREVVNVFVNLPTVRTEAQLAIFMQTLFDLQDHYGGLLNGLDFGDKGSNLLLFWGAPVAHENDIARALNFLLDLQTQTSIPLNAGVTYQIAYAGFNGSVLREDYTCFGRGVSLAARFMTTAARGEIWLDEPVARRAAAHFDIEFRGAQSFKGFATPQKIYLLLERKAEIDTFYTGALVGRQAELAQLHSFVQPIFNAAVAGLLLVTGDPGIGKSRLVHAFLQTLPPADFTLFLCQTDEILREAFNPLRYWLRAYFSVSALQVEARNKRSFNRKLDALIAATTDTQLAGELERTRSCLGALVGLLWSDSLYAQADAKWRYDNTVLGVMTLLCAESCQQPVVLLIEDAHWLDEDSRLFLVHCWHSLAAAVDRPYPIAILATARNEGGALLPEPTSYPQINLGGLARADLAQLAHALLDGPAQPSLLTLLEQRAEGNPFFAEQILHDVQERGLLVQRATGWTLSTIDAASLPSDVRTVLVARLDRLTGAVRNVVQTAAVLGREFELRLLTHMLQDDDLLPSKVTQAEQAAIWSALSEIRYLFKHALLRDAAYRMQVRAQHRQLHRLAAEAYVQLSAADSTPPYSSIAYHYEQAYQLGERAVQAQALIYLQKAGQQAVARFENGAAVDYFNRAVVLLASLPPTPNRDQQELLLQITLGQALVVAKGFGHGDVAQAFNRARELCEQMGDFAQRFPIVIGLASYYQVRAQHATALALGEQILEIAQRQPNTAYLVMAHMVLGLNLLFLGKLTLVRTHLERMIALYDIHLHAEFLASVGGGSDPGTFGLGTLGFTLWFLGYPDQALKRQDEALVLARSLTHPYSLAFALGIHMAVHQLRGETEAANARAEENIALSTQQEMPLWVAPAMCICGWALAAEGETAAGVAQMQQGLEMMDAMGTISLRPQYLAHLIAVLAKAGQFEQGLALVNAALSPDNTSDQRLYVAEMYRLKGDLLWRQGSAAEEIEVCYRQGIAIARGQAAKSFELRTTMSLCRLLQQQGRAKEGQQMLTDLYAWFSEGFDTRDLIEAKALLFELAGDRQS